MRLVSVEGFVISEDWADKGEYKPKDRLVCMYGESYAYMRVVAVNEQDIKVRFEKDYVEAVA